MLIQWPGGTRFFQRLVGFGQTLLQPFLFHPLKAIQFLLQFSLRALARGVAQAYYESRERLGFPMITAEDHAKLGARP